MRFLILTAAAFVAAATSQPALAQQAQNNVEGRVDRLEREMRAVQRRVFPGGSPQYFEPEIAPAQEPQSAPGVPASSPVADLTQRVAALESQLATMTGQVEQLQYRLRQMEQANSAFQASVTTRLDALEGRGAAAAPASATPAPAAPVRGNAGGASGAAAPGGSGASASSGTRGGDVAAPRGNRSEDRPAPATAARRAEVAAVERPSTGDPAEDTYTYGYRLWAAHLYPEAREQLQQVVTRYPNHRRASWAQNLLGRAYLDDGAPSLAAVAFYDNYRNNPNGERAPDSLFFLAQALRQLNKPSSDICSVYAELLEIYGDRITPQMRAQVDDGRRASRCR